MNTIRKNYLSSVHKVVIKVGTSTLTHSSGLLNLSRIEKLVRQIADIHNRGIEVILVSSGAIGAGVGKLGLKEKPKTIPEKQAAAAVGQGMLLHMYEKLFSEYGKITAQILLTREDICQRTRFLNARNTFFALLEQGVIPIVNENDAVVVDEIKFGDNDTLSAMVSSLSESDLLVILSDIEGLYDSNPNENVNAKLIPYVTCITKDVEDAAGGAGSNFGTGGMATKISAAKIAMSSGSSMIIVNGSSENILNDILDGKEVGTFFQAEKRPLQAKKHWMAFSTKPKEYLIVDDGAQKALTEKNTSLLPKGIIDVVGNFNEGTIVCIVDKSGKKIAHGISNYSSADINLIKGLDSSHIEKKLGYKNYDEVIHRDNLVILLDK
ncbi:glutamate 5-kinase [Haloimpatiens sp. FM7330]|uniref:glutamate 5-kinase n=1 Tax=Haloimpatiens sp. FM7330 TaxID=3298610 RepID=UPI00363BF19F